MEPRGNFRQQSLAVKVTVVYEARSQLRGEIERTQDIGAYAVCGELAVYMSVVMLIALAERIRYLAGLLRGATR